MKRFSQQAASVFPSINQGDNERSPKTGAQSVDLAGSDFIIIDSLNRGEFGTGIGRQMNIPVGGVESDKESSTAPDGGAAIIPGLQRYLPPNYYLDATRAVVRWAKPEDKQHFIESVECPIMTTNQVWLRVWKVEAKDNATGEVSYLYYTYEANPSSGGKTYTKLGWVEEFFDRNRYVLIRA